MEVLFTTNERIGSKFIRWVTAGKCSHVALLLDDGIVVHSTASRGVHLQWLDSFLSKNRVVDSTRIAPSPELLARLRSVEGRGYDWGLLLSMGLRRLNLPVQERDNPKLDLCTEVITEYYYNTPGLNLSPEELRIAMQET